MGVFEVLFGWLFLSIVILGGIYLGFRMVFYKTHSEREIEHVKVTKDTLSKAEVLIKKHQIQLQRSIGDIEVLNEELNKLRNDVKQLKSRNSQYRIENERLKNKIKILENKIEALL